ncbi:MAG: HdeD family acid-resistance protein [Ktedonobacterales bacterium]
MQASVRALGQEWWIFLLEGFVAIVFGLIALFWPGPTLGVIVLLFGLLALITGVVGVFAAIGAAGNHQPWGWKLTAALLGVLVGLAILRFPGVTVRVLLYLIGFWLILGGIVGIVETFARHTEVPHAWLLLLTSVISVLFGIVMFAWPSVGLRTVIFLVGIYALVEGIALCVLAFQVRRYANRTLGEARPPTGAYPAT